MKLSEITTIIAVDDHHLNELSYSFLTWKKYKKEILDSNFLIIYDEDQVKVNDKRFSIFNGLKVNFIPWNDKEYIYNDQREKMLTSLIVAPNYVKTKWYIKIDTDAIAVNNKRWIYDDWFYGDYIFISNPWGYTKPPNAIEIMDDWGDKIDKIKNFKRLEIHPKPGSDIVSHHRIISWIFVCLTEWTQEMSSFCKKENGTYKLPIPSQDTYLVYLAQRLGLNYKKVSFKKFGFDHLPFFHRMKKKCLEIL
jgi:hypothetical protein